MAQNLVLGCYQMCCMLRERACVGRNRLSDGNCSPLAFPPGDCTIGSSYCAHTACILCIIYQMLALASKLVLLGKAMHICWCEKCMWHKCVPEVSVSMYSCLHCLCHCIHTVEEKKIAWLSCERGATLPIKTKLHICRDGTQNQMWLLLNQWFAITITAAFGYFNLP